MMKTKEEWIDFDSLTCLKCDRFVDYINADGFCKECVEEEKNEE